MGTSPGGIRRGFDEHEDKLPGPALFSASSPEDADRGAVHQAYRNHLTRLGLATYKKPRKGELPEWDLKTGMLKAGSDGITPLGRLLLRRIGAKVVPDVEQG